MTKKHYVVIATVIKAHYKGKKDIKLLAVGLANNFIVDNPRFNREMFLTACGIEKS